MVSKHILIISIISAILILFSFNYHYSSAQSLIKKNYVNHNYGVEFDYPAGWIVEENDPTYFKIISPGLDEHKSGIAVFEFQIENLFFERELNDVVSYHIKKLEDERRAGSVGLPASSSFDLLEKDIVSIDNKNAGQLIFTDSIPYNKVLYTLKTKQLFFVIEDLAYSFKYTAAEEAYQDYEPIITSLINSITIN